MDFVKASRYTPSVDCIYMRGDMSLGLCKIYLNIMCIRCLVGMSLSVMHYSFMSSSCWWVVTVSTYHLGSLIPLGLYSVDGESSQTHNPVGCRS